jgi:hypothetical protein
MTFSELNRAIAAFERYRRSSNDEYVGNLRAILLNFVFAANVYVGLFLYHAPLKPLNASNRGRGSTQCMGLGLMFARWK